MAFDQTLFFKQCVNIYEESIPQAEIIEKGVNNGKADDEINDVNFFQKSSLIYNTLTSMDNLIDIIRPQYLIANSKEMSEDEKLIIDTEIKTKIQQISNTIKNFQSIEMKISKIELNSIEMSKNLQKIGFKMNDCNNNDETSTLKYISRNLISMGDYSDYLEVRNQTLLIIFQNIIKSLSITLNKVLIKYNEMHDKRIERLEQLKKSTLSTNFNYNNTENLAKEQIISDEFENLQTELPKQELTQLQNEQDSLLIELKKGTLETVTQIETKMVDISSMINEIGIQLNIQNENISILSDFKDDILKNVKSGNTVLIKANEKNSKFNKSFAWFIFFAGLILLIVDYIL